MSPSSRTIVLALVALVACCLVIVVPCAGEGALTVTITPTTPDGTSNEISAPATDSTSAGSSTHATASTSSVNLVAYSDNTCTATTGSMFMTSGSCQAGDSTSSVKVSCSGMAWVLSSYNNGDCSGTAIATVSGAGAASCGTYDGISAPVSYKADCAATSGGGGSGTGTKDVDPATTIAVTGYIDSHCSGEHKTVKGLSNTCSADGTGYSKITCSGAKWTSADYADSACAGTPTNVVSGSSASECVSIGNGIYGKVDCSSAAGLKSLSALALVAVAMLVSKMQHLAW